MNVYEWYDVISIFVNGMEWWSRYIMLRLLFEIKRYPDSTLLIHCIYIYKDYLVAWYIEFTCMKITRWQNLKR